MTTTKRTAKRKPAGVKKRPVAGWREWVELSEFTDVPIKVKIDSGARTSALHAFSLSIEERDGEEWAEFEIHPIQRSKKHSVRVSSPVLGYKRIRSSNGHSENRPVIRTPIKLGAQRFKIEVTLTSRDEMGFRMLLGRSAVRRRFWIDTGRSFLQSTPPSSKVEKK